MFLYPTVAAAACVEDFYEPQGTICKLTLVEALLQ